VISGAGSGIGAGLARFAATELGMTVVLADRDLTRAEHEVDLLRANGAVAVAVRMDVGDWTSVRHGADDVLAKWEHDYHKKYAHYLCDSEAKHPLLSCELGEWEEAGPLIILHYRGKRESNAGPNQPGIDQDLFTVTTERKGGQWVVTKYDAMY